MTRVTRVAVINDYYEAAPKSADWGSLGPDVDVTVFSEPLVGGKALTDALQPFDAVVSIRERATFGRRELEALPKLRLLIFTGHQRVRCIDQAAAEDLGITVCGTGGQDKPSQATAALTWWLIGAVTRNLVAEANAVKQGRWQTALGMDQYGKTLGVVGFGPIGSLVGQIGFTLGMQVIAWSPHLDKNRMAPFPFARAVSEEDLFRRSDVVSLHLVLSDSTSGIVGRDDLFSMKPGSFLVNTARAQLVDEDVFLDALRDGPLAGAGLDVFWKEPIPADHPLLSMPNVVLTPHVGGMSWDAFGRFFGSALQTIAAFNRGDPVAPLPPQDYAEIAE